MASLKKYILFMHIVRVNRKGVPVAGKEFFDLLYADNEFCEQLGRAVLAAGRLETELKLYLAANSVKYKEHATLGNLLDLLKNKGLMEKAQPSLELLRDQRNYLTHNLHALFSDLIEETVLERSDLLDSDVDTFTERAWQLVENLDALGDIVAKENTSLNQRSPVS
jgi:hypothetical protein